MGVIFKTVVVVNKGRMGILLGMSEHAHVMFSLFLSMLS